MERNPPWEEAKSRSVSQENPSLYGARRSIAVLKMSPPVRTLSHMTPVHTLHLVPVLPISVSYCPPRSSEWSPPFKLPTQNLVPISDLPYACYMTCPSPPSLKHDNIWPSVYKWCYSSSCCLLQPPVTSSLLGPDVLIVRLSNSSLCSPQA
jgi:hypothetical protein